MKPDEDRRSRHVSVARAALSGLCASMVAIGLARFIYPPLLPAQIAAGWFTPLQSDLLGAANLTGYLAGAAMARTHASRLNGATVVRSAMLLVTASFLAFSWPLSFAWSFLIRFLSGYGGGVVMVLAAPLLLPSVPVAYRGRVAGAIFTGVGLGLLLSSAATSVLAGVGISGTWQLFGLAASVVTVLGWRGWPSDTKIGRDDAIGAALPASAYWLAAEYALCAAALAPHMVFLVDYVTRDLGRGLAEGSSNWFAFGLGAAAGPYILGMLADRVGFRLALRVTIVIEAIAISLMAAVQTGASLIVTSCLIGAFVSGCVPLTLGRLHDLVSGEADRRRAWAICTVAFSIALAASTLAYSYLANAAQSHAVAFAVAAAAAFAALICDLKVERSLHARTTDRSSFNTGTGP